jgi:hypothetical protein
MPLSVAGDLDDFMKVNVGDRSVEAILFTPSEFSQAGLRRSCVQAQRPTNATPKKQCDKLASGPWV